MFKKVRNEVLNIISQKKKKEITRFTDYREAGVYMLYVDCFEDQRIIPFYIGQTSNFQARHKQHLTDIMALNRLQRECYEYALYTDLYNGQARPCKIFSYMVNHRCSLSDLHMIILEEIDNEVHRLKRENEYIDCLQASFFGFNQINSVLRFIEHDYGKCTLETVKQTMQYDAVMLVQYPEYGYNLYNWYRMCNHLNKYVPSSQSIPESFEKVLEQNKRLEQISSQMTEIRQYNGFQAREKLWKIAGKTIQEYFSKNRLRSKDMPKLVLDAWLFGFEKDIERLRKYFARTNLKSYDCLFDRINQMHGEKMMPIKQKVLANQKNYPLLEEEKKERMLSVLGQLLPDEYLSHPLGCLTESIPFKPVSGTENICYLNVEYTCLRSGVNYDFYPEICRIDYQITKDGETYSRTAYIENALSDFFDREDVYYSESGRKYGPFSPFLHGDADTYIPVSMEYKNGINEWTLKNVQAEDEYSVFKEINSHIDEKTIVFYSTSGYKSTILRIANTPRYEGMLIMKKLKRCCK